MEGTNPEEPAVAPRTPETEGSEADFEIVTAENIATMADNDLANNNNEATDNKPNFSMGDEAEATDKFPQQMTNSKANWNMMELGEKRKRLR